MFPVVPDVAAPCCLLDPARPKGVIERLGFLVGEEEHLAHAVAQYRTQDRILGEGRLSLRNEGHELHVMQPVHPVPCRLALRSLFLPWTSRCGRHGFLRVLNVQCRPDPSVRTTLLTDVTIPFIL